MQNINICFYYILLKSWYFLPFSTAASSPLDPFQLLPISNPAKPSLSLSFSDPEPKLRLTTPRLLFFLL